MSTFKFRITGCSDHLMWYSDRIGMFAPFVRIHEDCFMSREPAGYLNIIKHEDAEIVEVDENDNILRVVEFNPKVVL